MKATISIQELAQRLGQTVWEKDELKRIYLNDAGYNTKKMTTKAFIFEKDGEFVVSCKIECYSQPYQWIQSQENEVKESIYSQIEDCQSEDWGKEDESEDDIQTENTPVIPVITVKAEQPKIEREFINEFEINAKYQHAKFGIGIAISEDENTITLKFGDMEKKLLKKFAPLTKA